MKRMGDGVCRCWRPRESLLWQVVIQNFLFILLTCQVFGSDKKEFLVEISGAIQRVYDAARGAVVQVEGRDEFGAQRGSGFRLDSMGTICTVAGLVQGAEEVRVQFQGDWELAEVIGVDEWSGLAFLRMEREGSFLEAGKEEGVQVGEPILLVGYAFGSEVSPSWGLMVGIREGMGHRRFRLPHLLCSIPVAPGQVGSPILDFEGNYLGIVVSALSGGGMGLAVPASLIEKARQGLRREGRVRHGWFGIRLRGDTAGGEGVCLEGVDERGPAKIAGIQGGDCLIRVGQMGVHDLGSLARAVSEVYAGMEVELEFLRGGQKQTVRVTAGDLPWHGGGEQEKWSYESIVPSNLETGGIYPLMKVFEP